MSKCVSLSSASSSIRQILGSAVPDPPPNPRSPTPASTVLEMSASHIPNLSTLRRGGPRSRGRGHGGSTVPLNDTTPQSIPAQDSVIQSTDNDAATSRLSAVATGYLEDPFARLLTPGQHARRLPLMNRGTYARTTAIDRIVETFLVATPPGRKQIISLGAGSDTRYFRLKRKHEGVELRYHELDFGENTRGKVKLLTAPAFVGVAREMCGIDLGGTATVVTDDGAGLHSEDYHIHQMDLRRLPDADVPLRDIDPTLPTLIISECCLIYLSPTSADLVLSYFHALFPPNTPLAIAIYEPIRPSDAFGRTMVANLTARGIHLQTLEKYASLAAQRDRLRDCGFDGGAEAVDVELIWRRWLGAAERERLEGLEWMDEVEEFTLFARHYCVAWGWRGFGDGREWKELPVRAPDG
jgi:[phosphatase 2A protein]-leucine-carboxy methyltransferase